MARLLLITLILFCAIALIFIPWITGIAYVLNSLLQPQYLWPWVFEGVPIFKITAALAILGSIITLTKRKLSSDIFKETQNYCIVAIWILMHLSHALSPFKSSPVSVPADIVLGTINSIIIMYFVLLPLCESEKALKYLCYTFISVGLYYIYWANNAYLSAEWYKFIGGRLEGPVGSPYADGNALSTLIVMTLPFITLLYFRLKNIFIKLFILSVIPLAWHAITLFSSRAALLASVITIILTAYVLKSKKLNIFMIASFFIFIIYQGSTVLERTTTTIENAKIQGEEPINPRILSWSVGLKLIPEYPLFGVGVQQFESASASHFPGESPHVAHNTFLNFAVNSGLTSGILYLVLIFIVFKRLLRFRNIEIEFSNIFHYVLASSSIGLIGFFICSMFLDLIIFEPFYILLILNLLSYRAIENSRSVV